MNADEKHICIAEKVIPPKQKKKKVITLTNKWIFSPDDLIPEHQLSLTNQLLENLENKTIDQSNPHIVLARKLILEKIAGYKAQDTHKKLYSPEDFIIINIILQMMIQCSMTCYYCKEPVKLIYEEVRDPKQWTLERIENNKGHDIGNLQIACLTCNLRRRTMHHERYKQTKQMVVVEKLEHP